MFKNKNNYINKLENELAKLKEENLRLKDAYVSTQNYGLLSHIHDFLSDNNIHPSDIFLCNCPDDEFKITLTAVSGLAESDIKRFFALMPIMRITSMDYFLFITELKLI